MANIVLTPTTVAPGDTVDIKGTNFNKKYKFNLTTVNSANKEVGQSTNINRPQRDGSFEVGINAPTIEGNSLVRAYQNGVKVAEAAFLVQKVIVIPPPVDPTPTITSGPTVSTITQTGATISWTLSEPCTGQVEYGTTTNYGNQSTLDTSLLTNRSQTISGLTADTTYHFRVHSKDSAAQEVISNDATFKTAAVVVVPPPTGKVVQFPGSGAKTPAAFISLASDASIDVIQWAAGTYPWQEAYLNIVRPSTKPLLVQPAPGAAVIWDGGGSANPAWRIGWNSIAQPEVKAAYITIDPAGTGGSFTAQNYRLNLDGLVQARYYDHVAVNGIRVRDVYGTGTPQTVHCVYLDHVDGLAGHRGQYWQSNYWDVVGPTNRVLCGFQIDHTPSHDHAKAIGWTVENLHRWSYLWSDPTDVTIDGWTGKNCNVTIDNYPNNAQGVVKNCHAVNCGPLAPGAGSWVAGKLIDGGGNTSS